MDYFEIRLSEKGRQLLEAWEAGSAEKVRAATTGGDRGDVVKEAT